MTSEFGNFWNLRLLGFVSSQKCMLRSRFGCIFFTFSCSLCCKCFPAPSADTRCGRWLCGCTGMCWRPAPCVQALFAVAHSSPSRQNGILGEIQQPNRAPSGNGGGHYILVSRSRGQEMIGNRYAKVEITHMGCRSVALKGLALVK